MSRMTLRPIAAVKTAAKGVWLPIRKSVCDWGISRTSDAKRKTPQRVEGRTEQVCSM